MPMMRIIFYMFSKVKQSKLKCKNKHFRFLELRQCSLHVSTSNHCTTTMSLNSASGISSMMNYSEDNDIIQLQDRLQLTKNIPVN
jgi:hypothetical protein